MQDFRDVSSWNPADLFGHHNTVRFQSDTPRSNLREGATLGRCPSFVFDNGLHIVDPSGYSFWSKFFGIIIGVAFAVMTGNPYLGYEFYRAVDREISESHGVGEAIVRTYAVVLAMGGASGPSDSGLNPLADDPKQQAANARQAGELTHQSLDAAYGTHAEATTTVTQDLGLSPQVAAIEAQQMTVQAYFRPAFLTAQHTFFGDIVKCCG